MKSETEGHAYSDLPNCDTNNATRIGWQNWEGGLWPADYIPTYKYSYYKYLDRLNSGLQNGRVRQNKPYKTYILNRGLVQAVSDDLRLQDWLVKKSINYVDALQRSHMGIKSRIVAFCTCAYLVHEYNDNRQCHPQTNPDDFDYYFEEIRKELDISRSQFESVFGKVAHKIRNGELNFSSHDKYEIDSTSEQSWRTRSDTEIGWGKMM